MEEREPDFAAVVRPGDSILFTTKRHMDHDQLKKFVDTMEAKFPGVKVGLAAGVDGAIVYRPDDS